MVWTGVLDGGGPEWSRVATRRGRQYEDHSDNVQL